MKVVFYGSDEQERLQEAFDDGWNEAYEKIREGYDAGFEAGKKEAQREYLESGTFSEGYNMARDRIFKELRLITYATESQIDKLFSPTPILVASKKEKGFNKIVKYLEEQKNE